MPVHRSVLEDLGEELTGIVSPVSLCMALTVALVRVLNPDGLSGGSGVAIASTYYKEQADDSAGTKLTGSVINALIFVAIVAAMTCVLVLLFKYGCTKFIYAYMSFSGFSIYFMLSGIIILQLLHKFQIHVDWITFSFVLYNFSVVGVLCVFYWPAPILLKQGYLVLTGVVVAYVFTFIPEWTTWVLLLAMALYDLWAVLTPHGPLKVLVELAQERDEDIPALVYEARPAGRVAARQRQQQSPAELQGVTVEGHTPGCPTEGGRSGGEARPPALLQQQLHPSHHLAAARPAGDPAGVAVDSPGLASLGVSGAAAPEAAAALLGLEATEQPALSGDAASAPASEPEEQPAQPARQAPGSASVSYSWQQPAQSSGRHPDGSQQQAARQQEGQRSADPGSQQQAAARRDQQLRHRERSDAGEGDEESEWGLPEAIKLGLGDLIFYSVLVGRAAMYDMLSAFAAYLAIIAGLGMTLILLALARKALPALPISIVLGVSFYFLARFLLEPFVLNLSLNLLYF